MASEEEKSKSKSKLNSKILRDDLNKVFESMGSLKIGLDEFMALNCAKVIASYIAQGTVTTVDSGTGIGGGVYTGAGVGKMIINITMLSNLLLTTFKSKSENPTLALRLANDINSVCTVQNIITTATVGSTVTPSGTPTLDGGVGLGTFSSTPALISTRLMSCFIQMDYLNKGGDSFFAQEFAEAIHTYMITGTIKTTLQPPMTGNGNGIII